MSPLGRPVEEDDLHARIDGQLPRERTEDVEAYLAAHPEEEARFSQYAQQRQELRTAFSAQAGGPIPNRLRVAHLLAQQRHQGRRHLAQIAAAACLIVVGGIGGWAARDLTGPPSPSSPGAVASMITADAIAAYPDILGRGSPPGGGRRRPRGASRAVAVETTGPPARRPRSRGGRLPADGRAVAARRGRTGSSVHV